MLHILIICDTLIHARIARILLRHYPQCGIDRIEGEEYLGATGLHLAIAYGNDEVAQQILDVSKININERALGTVPVVWIKNNVCLFVLFLCLLGFGCWL